MILTLTMNPTIDRSASLQLVVPDRKLRCSGLLSEPGGGGVNVSRAVVKLGGESRAVFTAGGAAGEKLRHLLEAEGIRLHPVPIEGETRTALSLTEESTRRQYRFLFPGPELAESEWQACLDQLTKLQRPRFLVASGSLPPGVPNDFYARVAELARERGVPLVLDAGGDALAPAIEVGVFLVKPNLREFQQFVGRGHLDDRELEAAARDLVHRGRCEVVVISLGRAGVLLAWAEGCERIASPTVPIRSKVGAGDSTVAGIVLALTRGQAIASAARFGVAAGAAAVMTDGSELARREDTERLFRQMTE